VKKIEHLYLLIGTNPLSNYVVADYFLENTADLKSIHFIHSSEDLANRIQSTEPYAFNLKSVLEKKGKSIPIFLHPIRIMDAFTIETDVKNLLNDPKNANYLSKAHLDYSGGTKEMALYSYATFNEILKENVTFSYFDSRRNLLKKGPGREQNEIESVFLGDKVKIDFTDLFELHGYGKISKDEQSQSSFSLDFFKEFLEEIQNPDSFCAYLKWREHFFCVYPDPYKIIPADGKNMLNDLLPDIFEISSILKRTVFMKIHQEMPEHSLLEEQNGKYNLRTEISNKQMSKLIETRKYIVGHWFEQYAFLILQKYLAEEENIQMDLNVLVQTAAKNFEIDIALIKGYELCGISCTTDRTQSLCKSKGFEILHRTKQIAGKNSKSVLMTFMNEEDTKELDEDLSDILQDRILVLGLNDLFKEKICQKINNFLSL